MKGIMHGMEAQIEMFSLPAPKHTISWAHPMKLMDRDSLALMTLNNVAYSRAQYFFPFNTIGLNTFSF